MVADLRTESSDYRTELLSPDVTAETVTVPTEASWRLNMDGFNLPAERSKDSYFGLCSFVSSLSKLLSPFLLSPFHIIKLKLALKFSLIPSQGGREELHSITRGRINFSKDSTR